MDNKQENIKKLLRVTNWSGNIKMLFESMGSLMEGLENLQDKFLEDSVFEGLVNVYDKHFTNEEISDALVWHTSESGKKFIDLSPTLNQESQPVFLKIAEKFVGSLTGEEESEGSQDETG